MVADADAWSPQQQPDILSAVELIAGETFRTINIAAIDRTKQNPIVGIVEGVVGDRPIDAVFHAQASHGMIRHGNVSSNIIVGDNGIVTSEGTGWMPFENLSQKYWVGEEGRLLSPF